MLKDCLKKHTKRCIRTEEKNNELKDRSCMNEILNDGITEEDEKELFRIETIKYILSNMAEYEKMRAEIMEIREGKPRYKYVSPLAIKHNSDSDKDQ